MTITLRQICLVAEDLQSNLADFEAIFGLKVCFIDPGVGVFGLENALMPIGTNLLEIVSPTKAGTAGGRYLERRGGDGGYMVITQAESLQVQADVKSHAQDLGVRIAWERDWPIGGDHGNTEPANILQFHPADTGGAFFELDWDSLCEFEGHWLPAGGNGWQDKINQDVIGDFVAVEMQSEDPAALAQRWSTLTGLSLRQENDIPTLSFSNATLRFVQAVDGRGDGLGGLDVTARDAAKALKAARERGLQVTDNQIIICGTRFNLV